MRKFEKEVGQDIDIPAGWERIVIDKIGDLEERVTILQALIFIFFVTLPLVIAIVA